MLKWLLNESLCLMKKILFLSAAFTEIKTQLCLHSSSKKSICHLLTLPANCLLLNFISVFFFWMKLLPHYRIKRNSDRGILSSLYAVNLIVIAAMHLNIRSLQPSVPARGLKGFFSILHAAYYKGTDFNNAEFLYLVRTSLRSSVSVILM